MAEWFSGFMTQIRAMPPARRTALAVSTAGSLAFFFWLIVGLNETDYRLLYRDLDESEAAKVVEGLEAEKILYRLSEGGSAISVPAPQVHEARIRIAGRGLPGGGSAGFEIFDRSGFGVTDFVNRVNYQRALQGELARSIEQLESVEKARVQVALPERRRFVAGRKRQPSASVVVRMRPGRELDGSQVRGIVHLVASSIENVEPGAVTLVDERGQLLAPQAGDLDDGHPSGVLAHQRKIEKELARRIESILEPTVGADRVVARVSAQLDWTRSESTEERFDPDSQVARSESIFTETSSEGGRAAGGIPGIASNSPGGPRGAEGEGGGSSSTQSTESINYEISKVVSRTVAPVGSLQQLDVAVLVDGQPDAEGKGFVPWEEAELQQFEELAKRAVGFSIERGDRITVTHAPFRTLEIAEPQGGGIAPELILLVSTLLRVLGILIGLVLFARLVAKPLLERLTSPPQAGLPMRASDLELQLANAPSATEAAALRAPSPDALGGISRSAAEEGAKALRAWLSER